MKRKFSILWMLAFTLLFGVVAGMTTTASAATAVIDISTLKNTFKVNVSGEAEWTYNETSKNLFLTEAGGEYTLTGINADISVTVQSTAVGANIRLYDVAITTASSGVNAFIIDADCTVTLWGTNTVSGINVSAFYVSPGKNCVIDGSGSFTVETSANFGIGLAGNLSITGNARVVARGPSGAIVGSTAIIGIGDGASLTMINNSAGPKTHTFQQYDAASSYKWKLTNLTTTGNLTDAAIPVTVAAGATGTIQREAASTDVCQIGSTGYPTFAAAVAAATSGQTITMLKDFTETTPINLGAKNIIIDLQAFNLMIDVGSMLNSTAIETSGTLTVTGTGTLTAKGWYFGIHLTNTVSQTLNINGAAEVVAECTSTTNIASLGGITSEAVATTIAGTGKLTAKGAVASGIVFFNAAGQNRTASFQGLSSLTVTGGSVNGSGIRIPNSGTHALTFNLAGAASISGSGGYGFECYGNLTVTNSGASTLTFSSTGTDKSGIVTNYGSNLTLDGSGAIAASGAYGILCGGTLTVNTAVTANSTTAGYHGVTTVGGSDLTITGSNGSTLTATGNSGGKGITVNSNLILSGNVIVNATGGATGSGLGMGTGTVKLTDTNQTLTVKNNSSAAETHNYTIIPAIGYQWALSGSAAKTNAADPLTLSPISLVIPAGTTGTIKLTAAPASPFCGDDGSSTNPYQICTAAQLDEVRNYLDKSFVLNNDIDLSAYITANYATNGWLTIGNSTTHFTGDLDGDGHKITGLWISRGTADYIGLFGYTEGSIIKNVGVEIAAPGVNGRNYIGGLAGYIGSSTAVTNCYTSGNVSGGSWIGGLTGENNSSSTTNCYATGDVTAVTGYVGGLTGENLTSASITRCYATGNVTSGTGSFYVGGLVGINSMSSTITDSYATGNANGSATGNAVGGLVGTNYNSIITRCYATGSVTGVNNVGGLAGSNNSGSAIYDSFFDNQTTGRTNGIGSNTGQANVTGKSTADMKLQATFTNAPANWDFTSVWGINAAINQGYPILQWQAPAPAGLAVNVPADITVNGVTAHVTITGATHANGSFVAGELITVHVAYTGAASAMGTFSCGVTSASNAVTVTAAGGAANPYGYDAPKNGSPQNRDYTFTMPSASISDLTLIHTFAVASVTSISAGTTTLSSAGGTSAITISGSNLTGVTITAFDGATPTTITGGTGGSATAQTATLTFPANTSTTADKVYTVKISFDGGVTWETQTCTVTVSKATSALVDAETPIIIVQPQGVTVFEGDALMLSVTASVNDGGALSYQWYYYGGNTGILISGATAAGYSPPTTPTGIYYYYVIVTNTNTGATGNKIATATSSLAMVTVNTVIDLEIPVISVQPQNATVNEGEAVTLSVQASVSDGGSLSYQWYDGSTGLAISGATGDSYSPPTTPAGTYYYYVAVTNTKDSSTGNKTVTKESVVAKVIVKKATGFENVSKPDPLKAWIEAGTLHVSGLTAGKQWSVYNIAGCLIYQGVASGKAETRSIASLSKGVYIIKSAKEVVKISN